MNRQGGGKTVPGENLSGCPGELSCLFSVPPSPSLSLWKEGNEMGWVMGKGGREREGEGERGGWGNCFLRERSVQMSVRIMAKLNRCRRERGGRMKERKERDFSSVGGEGERKKEIHFSLSRKLFFVFFSALELAL